MSRLRSSIASLLLLVAFVSGCSRPSGDAVEPIAETPSSSPVSSADARDRLVALGDAWLRTSASVTYRTVAPVPGQAATAHLCLRQMFNGEIDRTSVLRRCSRQGRLQLTWDPPERWRMEVTTPLDRFTLISTHDRTRICPRGDPHSCRPISSASAIAKAGADAFFQRSEQILDAIGATEVAAIAPPSGNVGVPVECFATTGDVHVEWCYTSDGTLVSFLRGSATTGWVSVEATTVA